MSVTSFLLSSLLQAINTAIPWFVHAQISQTAATATATAAQPTRLCAAFFMLSSVLPRSSVSKSFLVAYFGIPGTERADRLAKSGSKQLQPLSTSTYQEAKTLLRNKDPNGEGPLETTTPLQTEPAIWQDMSRPLFSGCEQDTVASEHTFKRIGIIDSVLFDCKEAEQTVHHILQNCSIWQQQRHQLWPQDESTNKLWGTAEDLHRTIQFLATCRLRVKARLIDRRRRRRSVDPPLSL